MKTKAILFGLSMLVLFLTFGECDSSKETEKPDETDDQQVLTKIQSQLFGNPELKNREISVTFSKGVVTVSGQVNSNEERFQVGAMVRRTKGVKQVINRLDVVKSGKGEPSAPQEKLALGWRDCRNWRSPAFWMEATLDDVVSCLDASSQPMAQDGRDGTTPLHWTAMWNGNPLIIEALLDAGADPNANARNEYAPTPAPRGGFFGKISLQPGNCYGASQRRCRPDDSLQWWRNSAR